MAEIARENKVVVDGGDSEKVQGDPESVLSPLMVILKNSSYWLNQWRLSY